MRDTMNIRDLERQAMRDFLAQARTNTLCPMDLAKDAGKALVIVAGLFGIVVLIAGVLL
jgi:hypothetical protein